MPEFLLLIANNTNCMDVFALGRDTNIMARCHFVVDEKCANNLIRKGIYPSKILPESWVRKEQSLQIVLPHSTDNKKKMLKVEVYYVPIAAKANQTLK